MWTWQYYYMHPVVDSITVTAGTQYTGKFTVGRGPILQSVINNTVTSDSLFGNITGTGVTNHTVNSNVHQRDAVAINRYMWRRRFVYR